ncbi:YeeE/YedE thiosulfate transporter family protein [Mycobacterium kyorinense]|uniref:YeeE/YedE thiosulfate transporter family protein n=1 Tax=Mycobacterium kyorinense TaxID=487514 RepID=UPI000B2CE589|nr:YeeE/YedE thiosulfate transporter family protein [Mycobacterium kyorinense]
MTAPLWIGLVFGMAFGGIGEIWGIGNPETLIRLARWKDRLLVGCLAIACAIGAVALYGLYALGISMHFSPKPMYIVGVVIGGMLFGVGMAISGYVPGSELMALGEGRRDALYALPGGLLGAAAWTILYQTVVGHWLLHTAGYGDLILSGSVHHIRPVFTFLIAAVYAVALLAAAAFLPRYSGGKSCLVQAARRQTDAHDQNSMSDTAAYLAEGGLAEDRPERLHSLMITDVPNSNFYSRTKLATSVFIGGLVVVAIFLHQIFGESTTYSWFVGRVFLPHLEYSSVVIKKIGWEPFSDIGTFLGALIAAVFISRHFQGFRPVIPPSWRNRFGTSAMKRAIGSFGGFFVMMFGARMADGCTSGHILSGGVQMAASAWVFAIAVVIGMITTARVVYGNASEKVPG